MGKQYESKKGGNRETATFLHKFSTRERALLKRYKNIAGREIMPERLIKWQTWIADSELYLNELKNFVEAQEKKHSSGGHQRKG